MFESDDYDEILSAIDFSAVNHGQTTHNKNTFNENINLHDETESEAKNYKSKSTLDNRKSCKSPKNEGNPISPKYTKRKIIKKHFDPKSKRKFPGPAGLLTGLKEVEDEPIYQLDLLSQDIEYSCNGMVNDIHETALWKRLEEDTKSMIGINPIKSIKNQALAGNLQSKKAQIVRAFVETIDRSAIDPFITLRDSSGHIKCTLHRDAWNHFSTYIVSKHCALVLHKPTVLTTGSSFKKHYLNITLGNISAIYSSTVISETEQLPSGFIKICGEDYTILKTDTSLSDISLENKSLPDDLQCMEDDLDSIFAEAF